MSEINSMIIMLIMKICRLNIQSPKKVLVLRIFYMFKFIGFFVYSNFIICNVKHEKWLQQKKKNIFLKYFSFKKFKSIFSHFLFYFLSGSYQTNFMYFSLNMDLIAFPGYLFGLY